MQLSKKQNEYIVNATHRWNIKSGAVRSGKCSGAESSYGVGDLIARRLQETVVPSDRETLL